MTAVRAVAGVPASMPPPEAVQRANATAERRMDRRVAERDAVRRDVLRAVRAAEPSGTGAVKLSQVMHALGTRVRDLTWAVYAATVDRALQALRRAGTLKYLGRRDPKTGKPRSRWGWIVTPTSRKVKGPRP